MTVTSPTLAQRIAADIVATAEQYPLLRAITSLGDAHDVYDANESTIAALEAHTGKPFHTNMLVDECNEATDLIDRILRADGFEGLVRFAEAKIVQVTIPVRFVAEVVVDDSDPDAPRPLHIHRFVVTPWESFAGFFGGSEVEGDEPAPLAAAALRYWQECNDGTWPLDRISWEE